MHAVWQRSLVLAVGTSLLLGTGAAADETRYLIKPGDVVETVTGERIAIPTEIAPLQAALLSLLVPGTGSLWSGDIPGFVVGLLVRGTAAGAGSIGIWQGVGDSNAFFPLVLGFSSALAVIDGLWAFRAATIHNQAIADQITMLRSDPASRLATTESSAVTDTGRLRIPPHLLASIRLEGLHTTGIVTAADTAQLIVTVQNIGQGSAESTVVTTRTEGTPGLVIDHDLALGMIGPGQITMGTIAIKTDHQYRAGSVTIVVTVKDRWGFDTRPMSVSLQLEAAPAAGGTPLPRKER